MSETNSSLEGIKRLDEQRTELVIWKNVEKQLEQQKEKRLKNET